MGIRFTVDATDAPAPADNGGSGLTKFLACATLAIAGIGLWWLLRKPSSPTPVQLPPSGPASVATSRVSSATTASSTVSSGEEVAGQDDSPSDKEDISKAAPTRVTELTRAVPYDQLANMLQKLQPNQWDSALEGLRDREEGQILPLLAPHLSAGLTAERSALCSRHVMVAKAIWQAELKPAILVPECLKLQPTAKIGGALSNLYLSGSQDQQVGILFLLKAPDHQAALIMGVAQHVQLGATQHSSILTALVRSKLKIDSIIPKLPTGDLCMLHLAGDGIFNRVKGGLTTKLQQPVVQSSGSRSDFPFELKYAAEFHPTPTQAQKLAMDFQKQPATVDLLLHYSTIDNLALYVEVLNGLCCQQFSKMPRNPEVVSSVTTLHHQMKLNGCRDRVIESLRRALRDEVAVDQQNGAALFTLFKTEWQVEVPGCLNNLQLSS